MVGREKVNGRSVPVRLLTSRLPVHIQPRNQLYLIEGQPQLVNEASIDEPVASPNSLPRPIQTRTAKPKRSSSEGIENVLDLEVWYCAGLMSLTLAS